MHIVKYVTRNSIKTQKKEKSKVLLELKITNGFNYDLKSSFIIYLQGIFQPSIINLNTEVDIMSS